MKILLNLKKVSKNPFFAIAIQEVAVRIKYLSVYCARWQSQQGQGLPSTGPFSCGGDFIQPHNPVLEILFCVRQNTKYKRKTHILVAFQDHSRCLFSSPIVASQCISCIFRISQHFRCPYLAAAMVLTKSSGGKNHRFFCIDFSKQIRKGCLKNSELCH